MAVDGRPVGLVVERFVFVSEPTTPTDIFYVMIPGYEDSFPIRTRQMELVNASR
jgi:hypothetical protein